MRTPGPRAWIALLSVVTGRLPGLERPREAPCSDALLPRIREQIESQSGSTSKKVLLLKLAARLSDPEDAARLIITYPEVARGVFFSDASSSQQAILQAILCRPLGSLLSKVEQAKLMQHPELRGTYASRCRERELRREFLAVAREGG